MADPKAVVCTNIELPPGVHEFETDDTKTKAPGTDPIKRVIYMDDRIVPGSFYVEAVWVIGSIPRSHPEHCHDHDESLVLWAAIWTIRPISGPKLISSSMA